MGMSPRRPIWGNTFVYTIQQTSDTISGVNPLRADVSVLGSLVHGLTSEIRARTNWIQFVLPFKSGTYYTAYIIDRGTNHFNSFRMLSVPSQYRLDCSPTGRGAGSWARKTDVDGHEEAHTHTES